MSDSLLNEQREIYRKNFLEYGDTPLGVFWNNRETQYLRFERLLKNFNMSRQPFSIHDIGCGTCALHEYLLEKKIDHSYHGTEIVHEMIKVSLKKFNDIKIVERNILTEKDIEICDIGVVSGAFNYGGHPDKKKWKEYVFNMMNKIFSITSQGSSFNFLTSLNTFSHPSLYYFSPAEVLDYCMNNLSRFVILDHAYPLFEFTVTILKEDYLGKEYLNPVFKKYFP